MFEPQSNFYRDRVLSDSSLAALFFATAERIPGMIYQLLVLPNGEQRFLFISPSAADLFELPLHDLEADPALLVDIIAADYKEEYFRRVKRSVRTLEGFDMELALDLPRTGRRVYVRARSTPRRQSDGSIVFYGMALDVTKEKQAELRTRELEKLLELEREKLPQASRLTALGEMAAGIAHEINSPLTIIAGKSQYLQKLVEKNTIDAGVFQTNLEKIEQTAFRIAQIVRGLRYFSRDASLDPFEPACLKGLIEDALNFCRERFRLSGIEISVELRGTSYTVECRNVQISQVLLNLLNNSFDAIKTLSEKWIRVTVQDAGNYFSIQVIDSGRGIAEELRQRIMEPFFTTKEVGQGTGLGLSISKGIIEAHGGKLRLVEECSNTCFEILLPKPS